MEKENGKRAVFTESEDKYADIIGLPHHISKNRPHMSVEDRAAQFAPFSALTGHAEAIETTAKQMEERIDRLDHSYGEKDWD